MPIRFPCGYCYKPVAKSHKGIFCDICNFWIHKKCNNTSDSEYHRLALDDSTWSCHRCLSEEIPFHSTSDEFLKLTLQGKNTEFSHSIDPEENMNIQFFKDIENALAQNDINTEIECPYLSVSDLNSKKLKSFSCLHLNVASLQCHETEFNSLLQNSDTKFKIIGITESGYKDEQTAKELGRLPNYRHFDKCASSKKGGVRLYISKEIHSVERKDLQLYKKSQLESVVREIVSDKGKNFLVACIYKHPKMDDREFTILYSNLLEKINSENKKAIILGDCNLDLLNASENIYTNEFLQNNLCNFFVPQITRPTRVTPHSKTLIDNIFTNFPQEHVSCNLICAISDHLPQVTSLDITPRKSSKNHNHSHGETTTISTEKISY